MAKMFQPVEDIWKSLDRVANKGDFAVMDSSKLLQYAAKGIYFNGFKSAIHVTRECPTFYNVGFALQVGSPLLERINQVSYKIVTVFIFYEKTLAFVTLKCDLPFSDGTSNAKCRTHSTLAGGAAVHGMKASGQFYALIAVLCKL